MLKTISKVGLITKEYRTLSQIKGPLIFVERIADVAYNEVVEIVDPDGHPRLGQVLEVDQQHCMVRSFLGTTGLDLDRTRVRFMGDVIRLDVSLSMLGRVLNGSGQPIDGGSIDHPGSLPGYQRFTDQPLCPDASQRIHPDRYICYRRFEYSDAWPKAAYFLWSWLTG